MKKIVLDELLARADTPFTPVELATVEDVAVRLVRIEGEFPNHVHPGKAEMFLVYRGRMGVRVGNDVHWLEEGEALVVPGGIDHASFAEEPAYAIVLEAESIETKKTE